MKVASPEQLAIARALSALLAARRHIIGAAVLATFVLGVAVLLWPRSYTSSVALQPQSRRVGGNIAGLASQFGLNLPMGDNAQPPAFYSDLIRSEALLDTLVRRTFPSRDGETTLEAYYEVEGSSPEVRAVRTARRLQGDIHPSVNQRTGVLRVDLTLKDPVLAGAVLGALVDELNRYNQATRQSQARAERAFAEGRVADAQQQLRAAEDRMRRFLDANRGPRESPDLKFAEDGLQREITTRQQVYTTVMQLYEQARLEEVRDTPVLSVVEPTSVPVLPDSRRLVLKVLIAFVLTLVLGAITVLVRQALTVDREPDPLGRLETLRVAFVGELRRPWRLLWPGGV